MKPAITSLNFGMQVIYFYSLIAILCIESINAKELWVHNLFGQKSGECHSTDIVCMNYRFSIEIPESLLPIERNTGGTGSFEWSNQDGTITLQHDWKDTEIQSYSLDDYINISVCGTQSNNQEMDMQFGSTDVIKCYSKKGSSILYFVRGGNLDDYDFDGDFFCYNASFIVVDKQNLSRVIQRIYGCSSMNQFDRVSKAMIHIYESANLQLIDGACRMKKFSGLGCRE